MSDNFPDCLAFTIGPGPDPGGREGGYSNDKGDPGGPTNFGVTQASWSNWIGRPATVDDMRNLTRVAVVPFYAARFWNAMRCWGLPRGVDLMVFDCGVNAGCWPSARLLQTAVGTNVDGVIGPITALAARGADARATISKLHDLQTQHYEALNGFHLFGTDWLHRTDARRDTAMAMITP